MKTWIVVVLGVVLIVGGVIFYDLLPPRSPYSGLLVGHVVAIAVIIIGALMAIGGTLRIALRR